MRNTPREVPSSASFERIRLATYARPTVKDRIMGWLTPAPARWAIGTAFAVAIVGIVVVPRSNHVTPGDMATLVHIESPAPKATPTVTAIATPTPVVPVDKPTATIARNNASEPPPKPATPTVNPGVPATIDRQVGTIAEKRTENPRLIASAKPATVAKSNATRVLVANNAIRTPVKTTVAPTNTSSIVSPTPENAVITPRNTILQANRVNAIASVSRSTASADIVSVEPKEALLDPMPSTPVHSSTAAVTRVARNDAPESGHSMPRRYNLSGSRTDAWTESRELDIAPSGTGNGYRLASTAVPLVSVPTDSPGRTALR